jgi:hypothetical protein
MKVCDRQCCAIELVTPLLHLQVAINAASAQREPRSLLWCPSHLAWSTTGMAIARASRGIRWHSLFAYWQATNLRSNVAVELFICVVMLSHMQWSVCDCMCDCCTSHQRGATFHPQCMAARTALAPTQLEVATLDRAGWPPPSHTCEARSPSGSLNDLRQGKCCGATFHPQSG